MFVGLIGCTNVLVHVSARNVDCILHEIKYSTIFQEKYPYEILQAAAETIELMKSRVLQVRHQLELKNWECLYRLLFNGDCKLHMNL